jgi:hypothetical protein
MTRKEISAQEKRELVARLESCPGRPSKKLIADLARALRVQGKPRNASDPKRQAKAIAALWREPDLTIRKLAKICGASRASVRAWMREVFAGRAFVKENAAAFAKFLEHPLSEELYRLRTKSKGTHHGHGSKGYSDTR